MTITAEHLRQLFDSPLPDPQLVVEEGEANVVSAADCDQGLVAVSRDELPELRQCGLAATQPR